ncbi:MAG: hypothetical protein WBD75_09960 [Phycisphaerae bacterium]
MQLAFFRQHRKFFMVLMVLAVASMVLWSVGAKVMPQLLGWISGEGNPEVGTIAGAPVRQHELATFARQIRVAGRAARTLLYKLVPSVKTPEAQTDLSFQTAGRSIWPIVGNEFLDERADWSEVLTWMALYKEACQWGFGASGLEVEARIEALHKLGLTAKDFKQLIAQEAGDRDFFYESLRVDMTLRAYVDWLMETTAVVVQPELRRRFARIDEKMKVRLAVLKAEDLRDKVPEPSEEDLRKQFDACKQYLPGQGPKGFGYRIPDRVRIEYLVADPKVFEKDAEARVTDEDVEAAYEARKDPEFLVKEEPKKEDAEKKEAEAGDSTAAAETPKEKKFRPLEEVREEIRKSLVGHEAKRLAQEKMQGDVSEIRSMREAPDLQIWADGALVQYRAVPDMLTGEQLAAIEGVGGAARENRGLAEHALTLAELVGPERAQLAVNEMSELFTDADGRAYAFRVTGCEANHELASLDEVRDKVIADVRLEAAFESAVAAGRALLEAAAEPGLEAAAKKAGVAVEESDWFPRERMAPVGRMGRWFAFPPSLPVVGSNRLVVAECFRLDPKGQQRALITLAHEREAVVIEVVDRKAPREAAYELMRPLLADVVSRELAESVHEDVFDREAIRRRLRALLTLVEKAREGGVEPAAEPDEEF